jgi:hypothetical protein
VDSLVEAGSAEEIALFNPAFISRLLHGTVNEYTQVRVPGMPVPLAFLATPLVLHLPTRNDLPNNAATQMQGWIREHPRHLARVAQNVIALRSFTGMALRFAITHGVLVSDDGLLRPGGLRRKPRGFDQQETAEIAECIRAGRFIGRWFARQPDAATLLAWWGVSP